MGPYAWEAAIKKKSGTSLHAPQTYQEVGQKCQRQQDDKLKVHSSPDGFNLSEHSELMNLRRSGDVFEKIQMDLCLACKLPKPGATAGAVLRHCCNLFESLLLQCKPMTFKFGITHDASFRWHNRRFGYKFARDRFEKMVVCYAASDPYGPAFLEAALIDKYSGPLAAL